MVMVDVTVPAIGRKYNFNLEERARISMLISEIVEVICQKENCFLEGNADQLTLCCQEQQKLLNPEKTLSEYGIQNGSRLLLI